ncbi:arginase family protein [Candidatus Woesearchaeota archaeon]|nr:arginase family protein [Candidatus Woesearchaeota archaeon]
MIKPTFLNQPYLKDRSKCSEIVSVVGIGSNLEKSPDALRKLSERYSNIDGNAQPIKMYNPERGYILDGITFNDTGNIDVSSRPIEETIKKEIKKILDSNSFPLILGGDHYITFPAVSAYENEITVVQLDAHSDYLNEPNFPNGSVMRYVSKLPNVQKVIHCGLRGNLNTGPGIEDSIKDQNTVITSTELKDKGPASLLDKIKENEPIYLSFDIDVLDPSIAPATNYPEPAGIDYSIARRLICDLGKKGDVKGIDFVEYNSSFDSNNVTGIHIVNLIFEFLSSKFRKNERNLLDSGGNIPIIAATRNKKQPAKEDD